MKQQRLRIDLKWIIFFFIKYKWINDIINLLFSLAVLESRKRIIGFRINVIISKLKKPIEMYFLFWTLFLKGIF